MKQFKTIFAHEFCEHIKQKSFLVVTIIFVVAIAVVMFFPRITGSGDDSESGSSSSERSKIGLFTSAEVDAALAKRAFEQGEYYSEYEIVAVDSEEALKKGVTDKTYKYGYAVFSTSEYKFYINDLSISDDSRSESDEAIKRLNYATVMKAGGIPEADIEAAGSMQITGNIEVLGSDQASNYFYAYFMIFALYMIILLYGQMVAMGVASEKSSRAMEVLITSAQPNSLMFGKVIAACAAAIGQLVLILGTAFITYQINAPYWEGNRLIESIFNIPLNLIFYLLLFVVLGLLIYAMLFGAIGSMATRLEDINTLVTPITLVFVISFVIVIGGMTSDVNSTLMVIASYFPFSSPMAMFTRIVMGNIPAYEIIISVAILIASVIGCGIIAARIYRAGVLHYGKPPKFTEMLAKAKKSQ